MVLFLQDTCLNHYDHTLMMHQIVKNTENVKHSKELQRPDEGVLKVFEGSLNTPDRQRYS